MSTNYWSVNMKNGTAPVNIPFQCELFRWTCPNMTFSPRSQLPDPTSQYRDLMPTQTMLPKSYLDYCQMKLNDFCQQHAAAASSPLSREILKMQLMRALLARRRPGYLDFLQRYAAEHANGFTTPSIDYLDHIRQNATEDFRRNGVEVPIINNIGRNKGHKETPPTHNVDDAGINLCNSRVNKKRGSNSINTAETYQFTSTSLSNHETVDETTNSYKRSHTDEFCIPRNNKKNLFRHVRSRRQVNGCKKPGIMNRDNDMIQYFPSLQNKRPRHVGQYRTPSLQNGINSYLFNSLYKQDPLDSCGSNLETDP